MTSARCIRLVLSSSLFLPHSGPWKHSYQHLSILLIHDSSSYLSHISTSPSFLTILILSHTPHITLPQQPPFALIQELQFINSTSPNTPNSARETTWTYYPERTPKKTKMSKILLYLAKRSKNNFQDLYLYHEYNTRAHQPTTKYLYRIHNHTPRSCIVESLCTRHV